MHQALFIVLSVLFLVVLIWELIKALRREVATRSIISKDMQQLQQTVQQLVDRDIENHYHSEELQAEILRLRGLVRSTYVDGRLRHLPLSVQEYDDFIKSHGI